MPLGLDYVDRVNKEQRLARERFNQGQALTNEGLSDIQNSAVGRAIGLPRINELEQFIFKLRTELINYLIENAYIDGLKFDGLLYKPEGGKIVITADMIQAVVSKFGYITNQEAAELIAKMIGDGDFASKPWVRAYVTQYLVDNFYVSDENYVHTDNNFTDADKDKLDGLEIPVEDVQLNGTSVLNRETKVANVIITKEMVKEWYESNPDTNALTDAEKLKLSRVPDDLQNVLNEIIAHEKSHDLDIIEIKQLNARQETHLTQLDAEQVTQNINIEENKQNIINLTTDVALIKKKDESQDAEIASLKEKDVAHDSAISGLNTELEEVNMLAQAAVKDVTLDGATVVNEQKVAELTKESIKKSYESNTNTNAFTDAEKQKLQDMGAEMDDIAADVSSLEADLTEVRNLLNGKVSDVTLDGNSVVDEHMTAVFTASMIKASYESNPGTNPFTDEEKQTLAGLKTDMDDAAADISALEADIVTAKNNISTNSEKINEVKETADNAVRDVILNGTGVVDPATKVANLNITGTLTPEQIAKVDSLPENPGREIFLARYPIGVGYNVEDNITMPLYGRDYPMKVSAYTRPLKYNPSTFLLGFSSNSTLGRVEPVYTENPYVDVLLPNLSELFHDLRLDTDSGPSGSSIYYYLPFFGTDANSQWGYVVLNMWQWSLGIVYHENDDKYYARLSFPNLDAPNRWFELYSMGFPYITGFIEYSPSATKKDNSSDSHGISRSILL